MIARTAARCRIPAPLLPAALLVLVALAEAVHGQGFVTRYALHVEGVFPRPVRVVTGGIRAEVGVVEVAVDDTFTAKNPDPGSARAGEVGFFLPELDDEVLVLFARWFRRIALGSAEPRDASLLGFDAEGNVVARWTLAGAWPSRLALRPLGTAAESRRPGHDVVLQIDRMVPVPVEGAPPWPDVTATEVEPGTGRFRLAWRSVAGARYDVLRWNPATGRSTIEMADVDGEDGETSVEIAAGERAFFRVVLTALPAPPP